MKKEFDQQEINEIEERLKRINGEVGSLVPEFRVQAFELLSSILFSVKEIKTIGEEERLNLRNRCGHPGKYKPGIKKVSGFIEDMIGIVFG